MSQRELSTEQKNLIEMLVQHEDHIPVAAQRVGIPVETAQAWMQKPFMRTAFDTARHEAATRLIDQVQAGNFGEALPAHVVKDFASLASNPKEQDAAAQRYIAQLQLYMELPINKVLTWK